MIKLELDGSAGFVTDAELETVEPELRAAHAALALGTGKGAEFLGWRLLPINADRDELNRIKAAAKRIQSCADVLVIIGIGGSYLGARAVTELLSPDGVEVVFAGTNLSSDGTARILRGLHGRDFCINVVSKSGKTLEPAIALRIFRGELKRRYGAEEADRRTFATTDRHSGALHELALRHGWESFVVPENIGGRYSVLTAVGLLPAAAAGVDIDKLLNGAFRAMLNYDRRDMSNPVWRYAALRNLLYRKGKKIELFAHFEPQAHYFVEWLKQLFGESEGKDGRGIFPAGAEFTADLHSLGQYIQQGERTLMETMLLWESPCECLTVPAAADGADGLDYLAGMPLSEINSAMQRGVAEAHISGGVPVTRLTQERISEENLGELIYFFELACGISGYMSDVNPFDQPGVEAYKANVNRLLRCNE